MIDISLRVWGTTNKNGELVLVLSYAATVDHKLQFPIWVSYTNIRTMTSQ